MCGYVTYTNRAKRKCLGVKKSTLKKEGAVSAKCAGQMAKGGAKAAKTDVCLSVTGLAGMDRSKLDMLQNLASQGSSKGANEMLPFLMSAAAQGKKGGLKFNADEISAIIEVLKMGKSPAEAQKLDKVVNLMKMMR